MPFVSNSNYRLGAKVLTIRSIGTKAIIVAHAAGRHCCRQQGFG